MDSQAARGLVLHNNNILLMYREKKGKKYYAIPGGKAENGESLEDAVVRELFEETSIHVEIDKHLGAFVDKDKNKTQHLYLCKYVKGKPELRVDSVEQGFMNEDITNYFRPEWVDVDKLDSLTIKPFVIADFFKKTVLQLTN